MTTLISPNIKKTSERIDTNGNIINPNTKEIIRQTEPDYNIPSQIQAEPSKTSSKIDEMISKKIEQIISKKIEEALKNL